ncbi:MAG: XRE family transcriptional regulator [Gemmatimonadetes bacterium]|nr:XRE family transcriptional regulator [Gemmatimonadota bacterium]
MVRRARSNVFQDLGFSTPVAENLRVRAELMTRVRELIAHRELTQTEAAGVLGVSQPRVSDLVRGRIELFSIDSLVNMLAAAGCTIDVVPRPGKHRVA